MLHFVKETPGLGAVHTNRPLGSERSAKDIEDEAAANARNIGEIPTSLAKGFTSYCKVAGVDEEHGLVFGWGIVCKDGGKDYFDVQGNHIPEGAMLKAVTDFMGGEREAGEQHVRMGAGTVVHSFPLTTDIAKAMGIDAGGKTGWMVAVHPDRAMLAKFKSGELGGFSIGGDHIELDGKPVIH